MINPNSDAPVVKSKHRKKNKAPEAPLQFTRQDASAPAQEAPKKVRWVDREYEDGVMKTAGRALETKGPLKALDHLMAATKTQKIQMDITSKTAIFHLKQTIGRENITFLHVENNSIGLKNPLENIHFNIHAIYTFLHSISTWSLKKLQHTSEDARLHKSSIISKTLSVVEFLERLREKYINEQQKEIDNLTKALDYIKDPSEEYPPEIQATIDLYNLNQVTDINALETSIKQYLHALRPNVAPDSQSWYHGGIDSIAASQFIEHLNTLLGMVNEENLGKTVEQLRTLFPHFLTTDVKIKPTDIFILSDNGKFRINPSLLPLITFRNIEQFLMNLDLKKDKTLQANFERAFPLIIDSYKIMRQASFEYQYAEQFDAKRKNKMTVEEAVLLETETPQLHAVEISSSASPRSETAVLFEFARPQASEVRAFDAAEEQSSESSSSSAPQTALDTLRTSTSSSPSSSDVEDQLNIAQLREALAKAVRENAALQQEIQETAVRERRLESFLKLAEAKASEEKTKALYNAEQLSQAETRVSFVMHEKDVLQGTLESLEAQLRELESFNIQLREQLRTQADKIVDLESKLRAAEQQNLQLQDNITGLSTVVDREHLEQGRARSASATLSTENETLRTRLEELQAQMAAQEVALQSAQREQAAALTAQAEEVQRRLTAAEGAQREQEAAFAVERQRFQEQLAAQRVQNAVPQPPVQQVDQAPAQPPQPSAEELHLRAENQQLQAQVGALGQQVVESQTTLQRLQENWGKIPTWKKVVAGITIPIGIALLVTPLTAPAGAVVAGIGVGTVLFGGVTVGTAMLAGGSGLLAGGLIIGDVFPKVGSFLKSCFTGMASAVGSFFKSCFKKGNPPAADVGLRVGNNPQPGPGSLAGVLQQLDPQGQVPAARAAEAPAGMEPPAAQQPAAGVGFGFNGRRPGNPAIEEARQQILAGARRHAHISDAPANAAEPNPDDPAVDARP